MKRNSSHLPCSGIAGEFFYRLSQFALQAVIYLDGFVLINTFSGIPAGHDSFT